MTQPTHQPANYRPDIDGLRAIAVLLVIVYHAFPRMLPGGFVGVDIFFVISGFLITGIILRELKDGAFSFWRFYQRRILRIFPTLLCVLTAVLVFGWFSLLGDEYKALGKHVAGGAGFIANFLYWQEIGYWDISSTLKPLLHLWSLGIEEQFYFILPALLFCVWKKNLRIPIIVGILLLVSFNINLNLYRGKPELTFYFPYTRFWELLAGSVLAWVMNSPVVFLKNLLSKADKYLCRVFFESEGEYDGRYVRGFFSLVGLALIITAVVVCRADHHYPGKRALIPLFGALCLVASGSAAYINRLVLSRRILIWIGLISYPLYLWHWPLLAYCKILDGEQTGKMSWRLIKIGCIVVSFVLSWLTYKFVEGPIRFGKSHRNLKAGVLLVLLFTIGGLGLSVYLKDGLPNRFREFEMMQQQLIPPARFNELGKRYMPEIPDVCFEDSGSSRTIAVFGDSHARAAYVGLADYNKKNLINTVGITRTHYSIISKNGEIQYDLLNQMLSGIQKKDDIVAVFVFFRYRLPPKEGYGKILQYIIDSLSKAGKIVYIVADNPNFSFGPKTQITRPLSIAGRKEQRFEDKSDILKDQTKYLNELQQLRTATIIYTLDAWGPDGKCGMLADNGLPMYYDSNHLSEYGSRWQAEKILAPYLDEVAAR